MPKEIESEFDGSEIEGTEESKNEITLESLQELVMSQANTIEALKNEGASNVQALQQVISDKYGNLESNMHNLTKIIGEMAIGNSAGASNDDTEDLDLTDPAVAKKFINDQINNRVNEESNQKAETTKAYEKDYASMVFSMLDDELAPDGKPFSPEARKGITDMLRSDILDVHSQNGTKDAVINFREAKNRYYGLGKSHGFKGGDITGAGVGGSTMKTEGKKTYKYSDETKAMLKDFRVSEDWANKKLAAREV